jgi:hypothetical protein
VAAPFRFDRAFDLPIEPPALWPILADPRAYPRWWPWLRLTDADGLVPGTAARCEIRAPLPYRLRCVVHVDAVEPGRAVVATVTGDLAGPARLLVEPAPGGGSRARLTWSLALHAPVLHRLVPVTRPAMAWAHDTIVAAGLAQFRAHALRDHAARSTLAPIRPKH